jgi:hypothetical protein
MNSHIQFSLLDIVVVSHRAFSFLGEIVRKELVFQKGHHSFRVDQEQS